MTGEVASKPGVWLSWEFPAVLMESGKPFVIGQRYKISTFELSNIAKLIKGWTGEVIGAGFSLKDYLGKPGLMNVVHNQSGEKTYANIMTLAPLMRGMAAPAPVNPLVYFDIEQLKHGDRSQFELTPPFIQKMIQVSPEYAEIGQKADDALGDPIPW